VNRSVPLNPFRAGAAHVVQLRPVTRHDEPAHYSPNKPKDVHGSCSPERSPRAIMLAMSLDKSKERVRSECESRPPRTPRFVDHCARRLSHGPDAAVFAYTAAGFHCAMPPLQTTARFSLIELAPLQRGFLFAIDHFAQYEPRRAVDPGLAEPSGVGGMRWVRDRSVSKQA
jgi:hypothetical protein